MNYAHNISEVVILLLKGRMLQELSAQFLIPSTREIMYMYM